MNREAYKSEAKAMIDSLFRRVDAMEQKKNEIRGDLRDSIERQMAELRQKKRELRVKYNQLTEAGSDSWEEMKTAFSKSAVHFEEAISNISDEIKH